MPSGLAIRTSMKKTHFAVLMRLYSAGGAFVKLDVSRRKTAFQILLPHRLPLSEYTGNGGILLCPCLNFQSPILI